MKQIFKTIILTVGLLLTNNAIAQNCDFDLKTKDKFTGKTKVAFWFYLAPLGETPLTINNINGKFTVDIISRTSGVMQKGVTKGEIGQFRLANGEFASFIASENAEPTVNLYGTSSYFSTITAHFDITLEELTKIANSSPVAVKVMMGSNEIVKEFAKKKSEKIRLAAKCLIDYKD
jgi:hypothetical protein